MPSANPKQATEAVEDPIRQAVRVIEHKIRNLEKRKTKLETYKETQESGKELNQDQKIAVAKYNEVLQTLDFSRDLYKTVVSIANDSAKQQKKLARKEALERTQQEIAKVREVVFIQDTLRTTCTISRGAGCTEFLQGRNGAPKLTEEELRCLHTVVNELNLERKPKPDEPNFGHRVQKCAEHLVAIVDGKQREFAGTTYLKIKELLNTINESGFLDPIRYSAKPESETNEQMEETPSESRISAQAPEQGTTEEFNPGEVYIPPPESIIPTANLPVQVSQVPVVSGPAPVSGPLPVVAQPIPPHPASNLDNPYYVNAANYVPSSQQVQQTPQGPPAPQQQQQQPQQAQQQQNQQQQQAPRVNDVIGTPDFFFLQESELDSPDVTGQNAPIVSHIPPAVNAPIPSQTFTNQNFAGAPVQVIYPHPPPPQDMPHIPGFANPNPPPPIPMPPSHQQQNIPYSPQHPGGFQQPPNSQQMQQPYDPNAHQQESQHAIDDNMDQQQGQEIIASGDQNTNETPEWTQMNDAPLDDWGKSDVQEANQMPQQQSQPAWGEQRGGYRGRGNRRGNANGYNGRGRGGSYQQNGRGGGGGGQGTYYRNDNSNYQNGYQQRNYNNDGNSGYNGGFIKQPRGGGNNGSRGAPRGERGGMDRGGRGGQFRGGQRGGNRGGGSGYVQRKAQAQQ